MEKFESTIRSSFSERLKSGALDVQEARKMQRENTFYIRKEDMKGVEEGGWIATQGESKIHFDNLAAASDWAEQNGGLLLLDDNGSDCVTGMSRLWLFL
jgi:hypothetical protein